MNSQAVQVQTLVFPLFQGHLPPATAFPRAVSIRTRAEGNLLPPKLAGSLGKQRWG